MPASHYHHFIIWSSFLTCTETSFKRLWHNFALLSYLLKQFLIFKLTFFTHFGHAVHSGRNMQWWDDRQIVQTSVISPFGFFSFCCCERMLNLKVENVVSKLLSCTCLSYILQKANLIVVHPIRMSLTEVSNEGIVLLEIFSKPFEYIQSRPITTYSCCGREESNIEN